MLASDFITKREKLCKAKTRVIIDADTFHREMHKLFVEAQVSRGFADDCEKSDMILHNMNNMNNPQDKWL